MTEEKFPRSNARRTSGRNTDATPGKPDAPQSGIGTTLLGFAILGVGVLAIVGVFALLAGGDDSAPASADEEESRFNEFDACAAVNEIVERQLVSPGSADHQDCTDRDVVQTGERFKVEGWVDSENRMGALIRSEYTVVIEAGEDAWSVETVELR